MLTYMGTGMVRRGSTRFMLTSIFSLVRGGFNRLQDHESELNEQERERNVHSTVMDRYTTAFNKVLGGSW
jgi:hypothetical protein